MHAEVEKIFTNGHCGGAATQADYMCLLIAECQGQSKQGKCAQGQCWGLFWWTAHAILKSSFVQTLPRSSKHNLSICCCLSKLTSSGHLCALLFVICVMCNRYATGNGMEKIDPLQECEELELV